MMLTDAELFRYLPSRRTDFLARAIGQVLVDIERLFLNDIDEFLMYSQRTRPDYFSYNSGPVQFRFADGLVQPLAVWGEQLSLVLLPEPLQETPYDRLYRLSELAAAPAALRSCLNQTCTDIRLWTLQEDFDSTEAKEAAVSYRFEAGQELFYVIYLHGEADSDYLLPAAAVPREQVARCYSIKLGQELDPRS